MFAFDDIETSDAGSDVHSDSRRKLRSYFQPRHRHGFIRGGESQVDEASHFLGFFFLDEVQRVEVLYLGGDLAGKVGGVKLGDARHPTFAGEKVLPRVFRGIAHATDQAQTGNNDPSTQLLPAFRVLPNVVDGILHGADFFRIFIGNFNLESLFKGHD